MYQGRDHVAANVKAWCGSSTEACKGVAYPLFPASMEAHIDACRGWLNSISSSIIPWPDPLASL